MVQLSTLSKGCVFYGQQHDSSRQEERNCFLSFHTYFLFSFDALHELNLPNFFNLQFLFFLTIILLSTRCDTYNFTSNMVILIHDLTCVI